MFRCCFGFTVLSKHLEPGEKHSETLTRVFRKETSEKIVVLQSIEKNTISSQTQQGHYSRPKVLRPCDFLQWPICGDTRKRSARRQAPCARWRAQQSQVGKTSGSTYCENTSPSTQTIHSECDCFNRQREHVRLFFPGFRWNCGWSKSESDFLSCCVFLILSSLVVLSYDDLVHSAKEQHHCTDLASSWTRTSSSIWVQTLLALGQRQVAQFVKKTLPVLGRR